MAYLDPDHLARLGLRHLGCNVKISDRASIHNADQIEIGDHSRIDDFCVLSGRVVLGRNVHLAAHVHIAVASAAVLIPAFSAISSATQSVRPSRSGLPTRPV